MDISGIAELPELVEHILFFLVEEDAALSNKQGHILVQVCHLWYSCCSRIPDFWYFSLGYVAPEPPPLETRGGLRYEKCLWTNQVIIGVPACCDCAVRALDISYTQNLPQHEVDRSLIFFATFERQGEEPHFNCLQRVSIADNLTAMDGDWVKIFVHIDNLNIQLKKGQYAGLIYDTTHGFTPEEQKFFPRIPIGLTEGEKEWPVWFDREETEMCGFEPMSFTGWSLALVGILPPSQ
jgi:hypothetical protein